MFKALNTPSNEWYSKVYQPAENMGLPPYKEMTRRQIKVVTEVQSTSQDETLWDDKGMWINMQGFLDSTQAEDMMLEAWAWTKKFYINKLYILF